MKIKLSNAQIPERSTDGSAGYDLKVSMDEDYYILLPYETKLFGTGISIHIKDPNVAGIILPRSGLSSKHGIILSNTVGLMDSDWIGEYQIAAYNRSQTPYKVKNGERIAQLVFIPVIHPELVEVYFLEDTNRGQNGFGSSGKL